MTTPTDEIRDIVFESLARAFDHGCAKGIPGSQVRDELYNITDEALMAFVKRRNSMKEALLALDN